MTKKFHPKNSKLLNKKLLSNKPIVDFIKNINKRSLIFKTEVFIIVFLIIFNLIRSYKFIDSRYLTNKFDYKKYEKSYLLSQWVVPDSKNPIGDDILYTYAGVKYIQGTDPSLINAEHPPLGKNLIGIFAIYLHNEYFFSILSGICALFSFYLMSKSILKNNFFSLLLVIFIGVEPLFVANYFSNNLDLLIFSLLNFYFYFLIRYEANHRIKNIILANIFLGLIISVKFYLISLPIIISTLIYFFIKKDKKFLFFYFLTLPLAGLVLFINYFQYFLKNHSFIDFIKLQKYIFVFHIYGRKDAIMPNLSVFELLILGRFYPNLKNPVSEAHHSLIWSLATIIFYLSLFIRKLSLISSWIIFYTLFQSFSFTNVKYLIILIPYLYLIVFELINKKSKI